MGYVWSAFSAVPIEIHWKVWIFLPLCSLDDEYCPPNRLGVLILLSIVFCLFQNYLKTLLISLLYSNFLAKLPSNMSWNDIFFFDLGVLICAKKSRYNVLGLLYVLVWATKMPTKGLEFLGTLSDDLARARAW